MALSTAQTNTPFTILALAATFVGAAITFHFQLPGIATLLVGLVITSFFSIHPQFTGPKANGAPTPTRAEESALRGHRRRSELRWRLIITNSDWLPNAVADLPAYRVSINKSALRFYPAAFRARAQKSALLTDVLGFLAWVFIPSRAVYWAALGCAGLAFTFPASGYAWANALAAFILVTQLEASGRRHADLYLPRPAVSVGRITKAGRGSVIGAVAAGLTVSVGSTIGVIILEPGTPPIPELFLLVSAVFLIVTGAIMHAALKPAAIAPWSLSIGARDTWSSRWSALKVDPAPFLISRELVGEAGTPVDTFEASGALGGAAGAMNLRAKLTPLMGTGTRFALLSEPDIDASGQPITGSRHPLRFRVVTWAQDTIPNPADINVDREELALFTESSMFWAAAGASMPQPVFLGMEAIFGPADIATELDDADDAPAAPTTPTAAWATYWASNETDVQSILGACRGSIAEDFGSQTYVEQGVLYIGAVTEETTNLSSPDLISRIEEMAVVSRWDTRWYDILKLGQKAPVLQYRARTTAELDSKTTLHSQPFQVNQGLSLDPFFTAEMKGQLRTTLSRAPFLTVVNWAGAGNRKGERDAQAFAVIWSEQPVPSNPALILPTNRTAYTWALTATVNDAFAAAKLARPEFIATRPLTTLGDRNPKDVGGQRPSRPEFAALKPRTVSNNHIWEIQLRLYDGVTPAAVKAAGEKLRLALGCAWLRVTESEDGCTLYAGADPSSDSVKFKTINDQETCLQLDWEQAFLDSKVASPVDGGAPKLVASSVMPRNDKVQVLTFSFPRGLANGNIREALPKLRGATGNAFIEYASDANMKNFRLLVCKESPMIFPAPFAWDELLNGNVMSFGTSVEGEPMAFNWKLDPHLLVLGKSGTGKSATLQALLVAALLKGCEVHLADPVKGGADFKFAEPWMASVTADAISASAMLDAIYAEVQWRKTVNSEHGVSSYTDLPAAIRPKHVVVFIDEFTSLMEQDTVEKLTGYENDEELKNHDASIAINNAKTNIGRAVGRIAREARSAGVTLILATQSLKMETLKSIPGAGDLKTNMSSIILGKTTFGERQSALREPTEVPDMGDGVERGMGLFESSAFRPRIFQTWYDSNHLVSMTSRLEQNLTRLTPDQKLDVAKFVKVGPHIPTLGEIIERADDLDPETVTDLGEVDLGIDFGDFDDFDASDDDAGADAESEAAATEDAEAAEDPDVTAPGSTIIPITDPPLPFLQSSTAPVFGYNLFEDDDEDDEEDADEEDTGTGIGMDDQPGAEPDFDNLPMPVRLPAADLGAPLAPWSPADLFDSPPLRQPGAELFD